MLSSGGEVWQRDTQLAGLGERLVMTVALPYLWGLPPAFDTLRYVHIVPYLQLLVEVAHAYGMLGEKHE